MNSVIVVGPKPWSESKIAGFRKVNGDTWKDLRVKFVELSMSLGYLIIFQCCKVSICQYSYTTIHFLGS